MVFIIMLIVAVCVCALLAFFLYKTSVLDRFLLRPNAWFSNKKQLLAIPAIVLVVITLSSLLVLKLTADSPELKQLAVDNTTTNSNKTVKLTPGDDLVIKEKEEQTQEKKDEKSDTDNRLTNDQLSSLSSDELFEKHYTEEGKKELTELFGDSKLARDFAVTLIGKVIPVTQVKTIDGKDKRLDERSVIVVLNELPKSKEFAESIKALGLKESVNYFLLFPKNDSAFVKEYAEKNGIPKEWNLVSKEGNEKTEVRNDLLGIATYYFNVAGTPSYLVIEDNQVTIGGNTTDKELFKRVVQKGLSQDKLYNKATKEEQKKES